MKNKHVFESFQDFVEQIFEKRSSGLITEEEARASLSAAANKMIGSLELNASAKTLVETYFEKLETYLTGNDELAGKINDSVTSAFEIFNNEQKGISVDNAGASSFTKSSYNIAPYKWLINGEVEARGIPDAKKDPMTVTDTTQRIRLYDLLGLVNAYNLTTFSRNVKMASESKKEKDIPKYQGDAPVNPYLYLVDGSTGKRTIEFITNPAAQDASKRFVFSLYALNSDPTKGGGNNIEKDYFTEVIKPGGTEIAVKEKPYNSSGVDFFEENDVVISASGLSALKAMVSEFNKITEIKVNGSASSKPTSREGGNQQLAEDRRAAGIKALEDLKAAGVAQLKDAKILPGTATVQKDAPKDSDPAMQQVSFIVSGNARKSEVVDAAPITITKVEETKADSFVLRTYDVYVYYFGTLNA